MNTTPSSHQPTAPWACGWACWAGGDRRTPCWATRLPPARHPGATPALALVRVTGPRRAGGAAGGVSVGNTARHALSARSSGGTWAGPLLGNALGYPLLLAFALRSVTASHAAVVTALLLLVTAAVAALVLPPAMRAWGSGSSRCWAACWWRFAAARGWQQGHGLFSLEAADAPSWSATRWWRPWAYIHGAHHTRAGAERVICLGVPDGAARLHRPPRCGCGPAIPWPSAWGGFHQPWACSRWWLLRAWYRGWPWVNSFLLSFLSILFHSFGDPSIPSICPCVVFSLYSIPSSGTLVSSFSFPVPSIHPASPEITPSSGLAGCHLETFPGIRLLPSLGRQC